MCPLSVCPAVVIFRARCFQVDLSTLPVAVPSEEYDPPELEDAAFEQVWAPLPLGENGESTTDLDALVKEFGSVVSHDKVHCCN